MNRTDAGTEDDEAARYHLRQTQDGEVAKLFKGAQRSEVVDEDVRLFLVKGISCPKPIRSDQTDERSTERFERQRV